MEREACVCDHELERSDLCAEIINNNNNNELVHGDLPGNTLSELLRRTTGPVPADSLSAANTIGTQMRDQLTRD